MKYAIEMASGRMMYITKFHKVRLRRPNVVMEAAYTDTHTHTHTQQSDIISLLVFFFKISTVS
jgi:hypothetical protein